MVDMRLRSELEMLRLDLYRQLGESTAQESRARNENKDDDPHWKGKATATTRSSKEIRGMLEALGKLLRRRRRNDSAHEVAPGSIFEGYSIFDLPIHLEPSSTDPAWVLPPELFQMVLDNLWDDRELLTLGRARLVNQRWYRATRDATLRFCDTARVLDITQQRADIIEIMVLKAAEPVVGLSFPALREVRLCDCFPREGLLVSSYDLAMPFFTQHCPVLRSVQFDCLPSRLEPSQLAKLLRGSPSIADISFNRSWRDMLSAEVMNHLACRPNLTSLKIESHLTTWRVEEVRHHTREPFRAAHLLDLGVRRVSVLRTLLGPHNMHLKTLELNAAKPSCVDFRHLATLTALETLSVVYRYEGRVRKRDMQRLGTLPRLRRLTLDAGSILQLPDWTEVRMDRFLRRRKMLEFAAFWQDYRFDNDDGSIIHPRCGQHLLRRFAGWIRNDELEPSNTEDDDMTALSLLSLWEEE